MAAGGEVFGVTERVCPVLRFGVSNLTRDRSKPMTDGTISPLCRRMIEDMTVRGFAPATQTGYIRAVRDFAYRPRRWVATVRSFSSP